ncbi:hypothetical protein C1H46_000898 [Malus baccata]|uniref:Uncharacterized protein n=1 Tax=Malus baccata TaxID=106549 RepID=A0A540NRC2_MALBA|nr:hypothetical protein C1H46_000898 [Malus baccata]
MAGWRGPWKALPLKLRWISEERWQICGGIWLERLQRERSRETEGMRRKKDKVLSWFWGCREGVG